MTGEILKTANIKTALPDSEDNLVDGNDLMDLGMVGGGASLLPQAARRTIGQKNLYHGTTTESNADQILREGLDPNKGGKAGGGSDFYDAYYGLDDAGHFTDKSKNKVYVTPDKSLANQFAIPDDHEEFIRKAKNNNLSPEETRRLFAENPKRNINMRMPYSEYASSFEWDPDVVPMVDEEDLKDKPRVRQFIRDAHAGRSADKVDTKYIKGGKNYSTTDNYKRILKKFPEYAKNHYGRLGAGLAGLGVGGGLIYEGASDLLGSGNDGQGEQQGNSILESAGLT